MTAEHPAGGEPHREPLDYARLVVEVLGTGLPWVGVLVTGSTGSTNADLVDDAQAGAPEGTVLLAEEQRTGRGRLGRTWQAPARASLAMSFLVRPPAHSQGRWGWLPLLTGVAVAGAVEAVAGVAAGLKWPNDLLVGGRKLAGILAERVATPTGPAVVVGVGLNVSQTAAELPGATAVSLAGCGAADVDRTELAIEVLRRVAIGYHGWLADPEATRREYLDRSDTLHREVQVHLPGGRQLAGTALDVDDHGRLMVATSDGRTAVAAGDVVHLR